MYAFSTVSYVLALHQGFITALKQDVCRQRVRDCWALDDVSLHTEVVHPSKVLPCVMWSIIGHSFYSCKSSLCARQDVDTLRDGPSEGAYVYGLQLEGCAWSSKQNCMIDAEPRKLFCPLPLVLFTAIQVMCTSDVYIFAYLHRFVLLEYVYRHMVLSDSAI